MSFVSQLVDATDASRLALVAIGPDGERHEITFGEVAERSARMAGALVARGAGAGDVVMTVVGNRPEWVDAMLACWRIGAVASPVLGAAPARRPSRAYGERGAGGRGGRRARSRPGGRERLRGARAGRARRAPVDARAGRGGGLRGRGPRPDRLHIRHGRRAEADPPRPRLPGRSERAGRALVRSAARATCAGARPPAAGRSRRATPSWPPGCAARRRCSTTRASTPRSVSSCSTGSA